MGNICIWTSNNQKQWGIEGLCYIFIKKLQTTIFEGKMSQNLQYSLFSIYLLFLNLQLF